MRLSKTELKALEQIARGNKSIKGIAIAIKKSKVQIYRAVKQLAEKEFIQCSNGACKPERITHVTLLLQLLFKYPNIIKLLSNSGIDIFIAIIDQKTISEIMQETKLKRTIIFEKLKQAKQISLVTKQNKKYCLNEKIWPNAREFFIELKKYEEATDRRVPANSTIYYKNEKEIIFSTQEEVDAAVTGFSAYKEYGINILTPTIDYYLPKKKLTKEEVFMHSLHIAEKSKSIRNLTYVALFYLKFRKRLSMIKHKIIDNINSILKGQDIPGYPALNEIKEKAELYDIKL